ncbi:MAG: alkaline phosphatase family protein [Alphaproteobacteria bacterium]
MTEPRFIIVGFDALRPELITKAHTPNLAGWLQNAANFENARSVFPSETKVAMASIATGTWPGTHGVVANGYYEPATGDGALFDTGNVAQLARVTEANHGALVTAPTLAGALAAASKTYLTVSTGTAGNARFLNPRARDLGLVAYSIMGADASSPAANFDECNAKFGPPPAQAIPNTARCQYGARLFLEHFLPNHRPDVGVLWLSEPDITFHYRGVGSPESLTALSAMDDIFGDVLAWRDAQPDCETIHIIALSDHGHLAVKGRVHIIEEMQAAGFRAAASYGPDIDYVVLASSSGNVWIRDNDPTLTRDMAAWMTEQPWLGMLFARDPASAAGALPLSLVRNDHVRTPELMFVLDADEQRSRFGLKGRTLIGADSVPEDETGGVHGGLNASELSNFIALEGAMLTKREGLTAPAGLVDIAPTVLAVLGIKPPDEFEGRVLSECFQNGSPVPQTRRIVHEAGVGPFKQRLELLEVGGRVYLNQGGRIR